jgi:hypothetical protein
MILAPITLCWETGAPECQNRGVADNSGAERYQRPAWPSGAWPTGTSRTPRFCPFAERQKDSLERDGKGVREVREIISIENPDN